MFTFDNVNYYIIISVCIFSQNYLKFIFHTGVSWQVKFNQLGDTMGQYQYFQYYSSKEGREQPIALWDKETDMLDIDEQSADWSIFLSQADTGI